MSLRAIVTYRRISDSSTRKLVILNGIVANPEVEKEISDNTDDFEAIYIRRSGEPSRNLVLAADPDTI